MYIWQRIGIMFALWLVFTALVCIRSDYPLTPGTVILVILVALQGTGASIVYSNFSISSTTD